MKDKINTSKSKTFRKTSGIVFIVLGVLLILFISLGEKVLGAFGNFFASFFLGAFGLMSYLLLALLVFSGSFILLERKRTLSWLQIINFIIMFFMFALLVHLLVTNSIVSDTSFSAYLSKCYEANPITFGGWLAGLFVWPLYRSLKFFAYVLIGAVIIVNIFIASELFSPKSRKKMREKNKVKDNSNGFVIYEPIPGKRNGLSVFTINPSVEYGNVNYQKASQYNYMPPQVQPNANHQYNNFNGQPMPPNMNQPQFGGLYHGQNAGMQFNNEPSLYTTPQATQPFPSENMTSLQQAAFKELYGDVIQNTTSSRPQAVDTGLKNAPPMDFNSGDLPPKIVHEESTQTTENKYLDITEKESKYLKKESKEKEEAAKKLAALKGDRTINRPLTKKDIYVGPSVDVIKREPTTFIRDKQDEDSSYNFCNDTTETRIEKNYESHQEKLIKNDILSGERPRIVVDKFEKNIAPFVEIEEEPIEASFEENEYIDDLEDETVEEKEKVEYTAVSSDDEISNLLDSMSSLLSNTQKVLDEQDYAFDEEARYDRNKRVEGFQQKIIADDEQKPKSKPVHRYKSYIRPTIDLLNKPPVENVSHQENFEEIAAKIETVLAEFKIEARAVNFVTGPTVTRYEFELARGVSVKKLLPLSDDIAMRIKSSGSVRIQAPIPGKELFGIEVPNQHKRLVTLYSVLDSKEYKDAYGKLSFALGLDIGGKNIIPDLVDMPHLLIGGATGFGKSVCLNSLIISLMYRYSPEELRFILVDPKQVELTLYNGSPHLLLPEVVTEPEKAIKAFQWLIDEMERRFLLFKGEKVGDIISYNAKIDPRTVQKLPRVVLVVDELANLMSYNKSEIETRIGRLAQKARAAGIHLVCATQRPSKDIITGDIKVNLPGRLALKVISVNDSRTIFSQGGPEKLVGKGDMLYQAVDSDPIRLQGAFISKQEVDNVITFIKTNNECYFDEDISNEIVKEKAPKTEGEDSENLDPMFWEALKYCIEKKQASISMVQRRFGMGYNRAGKIIVDMEKKKLISEQLDSKPRQIFISMDEYDNLINK